MVSGSSEHTPGGTATEALQCSQCGATLHAPAWAPTITCPQCGAFLSIERGPNGNRTELAPPEKRIRRAAEPLTDETTALLALRELEESLKDVQAARHRRTGAARYWMGFLGSLLVAMVVAVLWIGDWAIPGLPSGVSSRAVGVLLAVLAVGASILSIHLRRREIAEETKRKEQKAWLEERIRKEKWAMYEEELEQRKGQENSEE